jgi:SAM-dependent methyltransferase
MPPTQTAPALQAASFRDPVGRVILAGERCLRVMTAPAGLVLEEFLATEVAQRGIEDGKIIATHTAGSIPDALLAELAETNWGEPLKPKVFDHETVAFANYPYEWPAEMFESAAHLTLDLASNVIPSGFNLKDASPWNVMFRGTEPVFLDLASFERRNPLDRLWLPYGQFTRTFLSPLVIWRVMRVPPGQHFRISRDGLKPADCFRRLGLARALLPPALEICTVPAAFAWWASRWKKVTADVRPARARSAEEAQFIVSHLLRRLERTLDRVRIRKPVTSEWTQYEDEVAEREFASGYFETKRQFIGEVLTLTQPKSCLDLGCNTGRFSLMAAAAGARVVAIDRDPASVGALYLKARAERRNLLPLVQDIARPAPALGWNNSESFAFLDRAVQARFEMVMVLALMHHLCLVERVPLVEVTRLLARLAARWLVVEFVPREDPLARRMPDAWIGGSDWSRYDQKVFEETFARYFRIARRTELAGSGRWIYLMEVHPGTIA